MKKIILFFLCIFNFSSFAYKLVVVTDEPSQQGAQKFIDLMKETYPFTALNMEYEIAAVDDLKCESLSEYGEEAIRCDSETAYQLAQNKNANDLVAISQMPKRAGTRIGGLSIATVEAGPRVALHEYLHRWFGDEYVYDKKLAVDNCKPSVISYLANLAFIRTKPPYTSEDTARALHEDDIPWYNYIKLDTPITNIFINSLDEKVFRLGTPDSYLQEIGLFKSDVCNNLDPKLPIWRPETTLTIMYDEKLPMSHWQEEYVKNDLIDDGAFLKAVVDEKKSINDSIPRLEKK